MKRRDLILGAAIVPMLATPAATSTESPLRALYHRWQAVKDEYSALPGDCSEKLEQAVFDSMLRLEHQAADFEPRTMEDLYFKIVFADDNGDMDLNIHQTSLVAMSYRALGVVPEQRGNFGS